MRIIAVRHGETEGNKTGVIQGHQHGKLNDEGIKQVAATSEKLANEHIDAAYVSDLKRCKQTAEIILHKHPGIKPIFTDRLREMHFGEWENQSIDKIDWNYLNEDPMRRRPPGGESMQEFHDRVVNFTNSLFDKHKKDTVLLITHGGFIRFLMANYYGISFHNALSTIKTRNAAQVRIEINKALKPENTVVSH